MRFKKTISIAALAAAAALVMPANAAFSASQKANKPVLHISYNDHAKGVRATQVFITHIPSGCVASVSYPSLAPASLTATSKNRTARATLVTPTTRGKYVVSAVLADTAACGSFRGTTISKKFFVPGRKVTPHVKPSKPAKTAEPTPSATPTSTPS